MILLLPLKLLLIAIDLLITLLTFGWVNAVKKALEGPKMRSVPVGDTMSHRVDPQFKGKLSTQAHPGHSTLYDIVVDAFKRFGSRNCMGVREFKGWKSKKVKEFGDVKWLTYSDVGVKAHKFGSALRAAGMQPAPAKTDLAACRDPTRLAVFENTCPEWMISTIGAFTQGITVVTVYATLGMDSVVEAVKENSIPVILCNKKDLKRLVEKCRQMPSLKTVVYTNDLCDPNENIQVPDAPRGVKLVAFDDFVESGNTTAYPPTPPSPDTTAVVMYTSGSTGKPKGVVITHRQIVAVASGAKIRFKVAEGQDVYLAYLPLAHIMELMAEFLMVSEGCALCYADPKSLTQTGSYPLGALEQYKPTLMVAVPKIWDVIKKGIQAKVSAGGKIKEFLFYTAMEWRGFAMKHGFDTPFFKALVFKKVAAATGGRLRMAVSGGGPLNTEVQEFVRTAFGMVLIQGYGLTETNAGATVQDFDDFRGGIAGMPIPSVEIKLESTPEVMDKKGKPYLATDTEDVDGEPVFGRGEICIRGPSVTSGYYMMPDKTREVFKEDGWFLTGDIGQFQSDGSVRIVDRKKNLVKLKGGEYIAMEKMEMTYGNSNFVDAVAGGICCYGDGDMDRPIALMQLSEPHTMKWAAANNISGTFETIKDSKELYDAVMEDLKFEHGKSDLSHLEKLAAVALLTSPWTPDNGCLTAANKLQRRAVVQQFEKEFEETKKKGVF